MMNNKPFFKKGNLRGDRVRVLRNFRYEKFATLRFFISYAIIRANENKKSIFNGRI